MDSNDLSMRLLVVFDALYRQRSVTAAARELGIGQPTVSGYLRRLRVALKDPLFVRAGAGIEPTLHAQKLAGPLRQALELLRTASAARSSFDPDAPTTFRVCMTDTTQFVVLPRILERFRTEAPAARISVERYGSATLDRLRTGELDLLVGQVEEVGDGFYEQTLLRRDFVCLCSASHPRIRRSISLRAFTKEEQVLVKSHASGLLAAERKFEELRVHRNIRVVVPDFLSIEPLLAESEMIATVPRGVAQMLAAKGRLKWVEHPVPLPSYPVKQHWHERFHRDARNQWLRRLVTDVFRSDMLAPRR